MRPSQWIGPEDRERIEAAVRAAEAGTSGEIVVHVAGRSDPFVVSPWRLGALLAGTLLLAAGLFAPGLSLLELFVFQGVAFALAHGACAVDAVRRLCLRETELQRAAERGALDAFVRHVARRTEARTGILIYVSLLERRVVVLGEEAIDRALAPGESWDGVVALVLEGLRAGRPADGLVAAIARCGAMLARPLPPSAENRDEIPRGLILAD